MAVLLLLQPLQRFDLRTYGLAHGMCLPYPPGMI
jgi:hypothetical protein